MTNTAQHNTAQHKAQVAKLASIIQHKMSIHQYDVEPHYIPELQQAVGLIRLAITAIPTDENGWFWREHSKLFANHPAVSKAFTSMLSYAQQTLQKENGRFTFWHVAALVMITSHSYATRLADGKHKTVDFTDQKTIQSMEPDVCVLLLNHLSNRIFTAPLKTLHELISSEQYDVSVFFSFFRQQIALCNQ